MFGRAQCAALFFLLLGTTLAPAADIAHLRNGFTIRHERRQDFGDSTRLYLTADGTSFVDIPTDDIESYEHDDSIAPPPDTPPAAKHQAMNIADVVQSASDRHHLDPDLVNSVIHAESRFNPKAVSPKGARGLMQLMPQTAGDLGVSNSFDPQQNVEAGTRYLRELLERYNFDLLKALAAYNAGPARVEQYGGVPPYRETRAYVSKIVRDFNKKKIAQRQPAPAQPAPAKTAQPTITVVGKP